MDHQRALKNSQAFNESIGRRRAEFELSRAMRIVRETENSYGGQIGNLRERIMQASDELQRSIEERSIMQSKLQNAQHRIDQLNSQLKEVENSRSELERQKIGNSNFERVKSDLENEIRQMRRQLEQARASERNLNETVYQAEGRSDQSRREIMDLEKELRVLRTENNLLQSKLATKDTVTRNNSVITGTPMIPSIPVINVPKQQAVPLEILIDSPVERRNTKRLSTGKAAASSPIKKSKTVADPVTVIMSTPAAATPSALLVPSSNENINGGNKVGLSSLLEGVGKKKIKLPERPGKITITSSEVPRSTPIGKGDPAVMETIMSGFKIPSVSLKK